MKKNKKYQSKDVSPVDWYLACYIHRFKVIGEKEDKPNNRFTAWENTILIKAKGPEEAYNKAIEEAKTGCEPYKNTDGEMVKFVFEGLTSLIPIYENLEDGTEIAWAEYENRTLKKIRSWIKDKAELEVFEDYSEKKTTPNKK